MLLKNNEPLWPQLKPAIPLWTNWKQAVQQYERPDVGWIRVAVNVKEKS